MAAKSSSFQDMEESKQKELKKVDLDQCDKQ